ncbi:oxidoreductase [Nonomuraea sp. NN258]|uniref:ferredoxin reductase n=1 Tax=Nonomuraea antri TaxID=2730852 RepID=UPI001569704B|nr:ferredoxin reductase [Nonomuraea antri]NRQ38181.1 oxidoreductase [Nonomuraea antri]
MTRWRPARLVETREETPTARTLVFDVPGWPGHLPGQHLDVRLTADDGYTARRSYSLATAEGVELTVQRLDDGEVSPYLTEVMEPGDRLEVRGPVGGWFVWRHADPAPVLLVAGGAGIVPLMAMIRARRAAGVSTPFHLVYSLRSPEQLFYADELAKADPGVEITLIHTRVRGSRLNAADLPGPGADCFVCGPTGFVEAAADLLVDLGHDPARIKTERFGASS